MNTKTKSPRHRAVAIIVQDDHILVMYRYKTERGAYYIFPGGGIELGETPEEACLRELQEETSLHGTLSKKLLTFENDGNTEHYFLITNCQGELALGGPERLKQSPENQYRLEWVALSQLPHIGILPSEVIEPLLLALKSTI